jgi:release factor glutamine methyltransferase
MTGLRGLVRTGSRTLAEAGIASAVVDALELAAHILGVEGAEVRRRMILGGALPAEIEQRYAAELAERARRVPLQHLTGRAHFRRLTLHVGPGVFVPRPETEGLVELALAELQRRLAAPTRRDPLSNAVLGGERSGTPVRSTPNTAFGEVGEGGLRVVDLCSGSGAIALSLKHERPDLSVRAVEVSPEAVAWATANRDRLGLDVEMVTGDATADCLPDWAGTVDVVTANPPYIPLGAVPVDPEVRDHDPEIALYGGSADGLAIPLAVARAAAGLLRPDGLLLMEHADTQGVTLPTALRSTGQWADVVDHRDLAGRPRVVAARRAAGRSPGHERTVGAD